jgi:hypothetical protein
MSYTLTKEEKLQNAERLKMLGEAKKQQDHEEYERKYAEWKAKSEPSKPKHKYPSNYTPPKKKRRK